MGNQIEKFTRRVENGLKIINGVNEGGTYKPGAITGAKNGTLVKLFEQRKQLEELLKYQPTSGNNRRGTVGEASTMMSGGKLPR